MMGEEMTQQKVLNESLGLAKWKVKTSVLVQNCWT